MNLWIKLQRENSAWVSLQVDSVAYHNYFFGSLSSFHTPSATTSKIFFWSNDIGIMRRESLAENADPVTSMGLNNFQLARFSNCADLFAHHRVVVHGFALVEWREHKKVSEEEEDYMSRNSVVWNVVLWRITCPFWSLSIALWIQNAIAHLHTGLHDIVHLTRILQSSKYAPLNPEPRTPHMQLHFSRVTNPIMYYYPPSCLLQIQGWNHILCKSWCYSTMLPNPEHVVYTSPSLSFSSTRKRKETIQQTKPKPKQRDLQV